MSMVLAVAAEAEDDEDMCSCTGPKRARLEAEAEEEDEEGEGGLVPDKGGVPAMPSATATAPATASTTDSELDDDGRDSNETTSSDLGSLDSSCFSEEVDSTLSCDCVTAATASDVVPEPAIRSILTPLACNRPRHRRRIQFGMVDVFYFNRQQSFCSVPSIGGSALGMEMQHFLVERHLLFPTEPPMLGEAEQVRVVVPAAAPAERAAMLQPILAKHRRTLLRNSGSQRIESVDTDVCDLIRSSRERCGCQCTDGNCSVESCVCARNDIRCQVDRGGFPCACGAGITPQGGSNGTGGCSNPRGRLEFNPVRVRTHFIHTMMRLQMHDRYHQHRFRQRRRQHRHLELGSAQMEAGAVDDLMSAEEQDTNEDDDEEDDDEEEEEEDVSQCNSTRQGSCRDCQNDKYLQVLMTEWSRQIDEKLRVAASSLPASVMCAPQMGSMAVPGEYQLMSPWQHHQHHAAHTSYQPYPLGVYAPGPLYHLGTLVVGGGMLQAHPHHPYSQLYPPPPLPPTHDFLGNPFSTVPGPEYLTRLPYHVGITGQSTAIPSATCTSTASSLESIKPLLYSKIDHHNNPCDDEDVQQQPQQQTPETLDNDKTTSLPHKKRNRSSSSSSSNGGSDLQSGVGVYQPASSAPVSVITDGGLGNIAISHDDGDRHGNHPAEDVCVISHEPNGQLFTVLQPVSRSGIVSSFYRHSHPDNDSNISSHHDNKDCSMCGGATPSDLDSATSTLACS